MTIQVPPAVGSSGQFLDSIVITSSTRRQVVVLGDPASSGNIAAVSAAGGLALSSGVVTLSSVHTVTATGPTTITSGTVTLSSAIAISSGTVTLSSAASLSSGIVTLSSAIAVSSGTITSTEATNPWSSAPGFNVPMVSASSGVVQVLTTGTLIAALTSGTVTSTAGTNPWSSAPGFNVPVLSASSGVVQTLDSTSQAYSIFMTITSSAGNLSTTIKGTPATLAGYSIFNTNAAARYFKFFNTTSAPTVGTATPVLTLLIPGSTAGAGAVQTLGKGVGFSAGLSMAITDGIQTTSTGAISAGDIAGNVYYT